MRGLLFFALCAFLPGCELPSKAGGESAAGAEVADLSPSEGTAQRGEGREAAGAEALAPEACLARFEALKASPNAPLALVDGQQRAGLFGRVRGAPSFFVREPRAADAAALGPELARALRPTSKVEGARFRRLRQRLRAEPSKLRQAALREGYVYATDPIEALDLVTSLRISDLFDEPEVWLQRGAHTFRLVRSVVGRGDASYRYADGPRAGHDADLLFLDRLAASATELEVPLHRDVADEGEAWGFDRVRLANVSGVDAAAELRLGGRWVRAVLRAEGPALRVACLAEGTDVRANVLSWRAGREVERKGKRALFDAVTSQADEGLRFDRPAGDPPPPDSDGQLRAGWQAAFFGGYTTFFHEGRAYPVLSPRGEPWPPQVCVDFVLESFERASGTRFSVDGGPSRLVGRLDFDTYRPANRRGVLALEAFAIEHPELFTAMRLPERERTPFYLRERYFGYLLEHADDFAAGDIVAIQGLKRDDKVHQHALLIETVDPLTGFPYGLADQMRRPRRRTWEAIMAEAPRRSLLFRLRPTELVWSTLGPSNEPPQAHGPDLPDAPTRPALTWPAPQPAPPTSSARGRRRARAGPRARAPRLR
ncbi:MAG: hypothetical protein MUF34_24385 [Polyangiaceae bacterium]|nr:hypothetical protein [Polyangiaceae bacterium]